MRYFFVEFYFFIDKNAVYPYVKSDGIDKSFFELNH